MIPPSAGVHRIASIDDPRVAPYRNLRDRTLRGESLFITEGRVLTRRLLESRYAVESLFCSDEFAPEFIARIAGRAPVFVAPEPLLLEVVGFDFHRGVLGLGRREAEPALDAVLPPPAASQSLRIVVCPEITKPENMGLIFRSAQAFGFDLFLLGPQCCEPFSRRCLRVSMGGVFAVPFVKARDLQAAIDRLRQEWRVEFFAAVLEDGARPLPDVRWPDRAAVMLGNEFDGLRHRWLDACEHRVTIPMAAGIDSLNLGVAAGVFLYQMRRALP